MLLLNSFYLVGLSTALAAVAAPGPENACGKLNVIFTGLPPYHPLVTQQGFDPAKVDAALRADAANIVKAGYNLKGKSTGPLSLGNLSYRVSNTDVNLVVLMGPEKNVTVLREQVRGTVWDGTGIGYGVRGSNRVDLTTRLQEIVEVYREQAPLAPILFDYSPSTARWAIEQRFPLPSNCTDSPGKSLGFEVFCDICTGS